MQNNDKVVAIRFLARVAGRLHRRSQDINVFLINVNLLKLVYTNLRVSVLNLMLDNTRTNRWTQILEDLKR